jgi:hypothetical protein
LPKSGGARSPRPLKSAISSRREHTPQAPPSLKTPATTHPKHHPHHHKHTQNRTTETHITNSTPQPHPNTTTHRPVSALLPYTSYAPITRHLCPQTTVRAQGVAPLYRTLHHTSRKVHRARPRRPPTRSTCSLAPRTIPTPHQRPIHPRTPRSAPPLSKSQHGFSPSPNPLFSHRTPSPPPDYLRATRGGVSVGGVGGEGRQPADGPTASVGVVFKPACHHEALGLAQSARERGVGGVECPVSAWDGVACARDGGAIKGDTVGLVGGGGVEGVLAQVLEGGVGVEGALAVSVVAVGDDVGGGALCA